jgi:hypothetical protein
MCGHISNILHCHTLSGNILIIVIHPKMLVNVEPSIGHEASSHPSMAGGLGRVIHRVIGCHRDGNGKELFSDFREGLSRLSM